MPKFELHLETAESAATAKQSIALRDLYADDLQIDVLATQDGPEMDGATGMVPVIVTLSARHHS